MLKCVNHPEKDAKFQCTVCYKLCCDECLITVEGIPCCQKCIAENMKGKVKEAHPVTVKLMQPEPSPPQPYIPAEMYKPRVFTISQPVEQTQEQECRQPVQPQAQEYYNPPPVQLSQPCTYQPDKNKPDYNRYAGIMLVCSGILGLISPVLVTAFFGPYIIPFTNKIYPNACEWISLGFGASFAFSTLGIIGGLLALKRRFFFAVLLFGFLSMLSWGLFAGTLLSLFAAILVFSDYGKYDELARKRKISLKCKKRIQHRLVVKSVKVVAVCALVIIPVFSTIIYTGVQPGSNSKLFFDGNLYFSRDDLSASQTRVKVTGYLANMGISDSGPVRVVAFLRDANGISEGKTDINVGTIKSHKTVEIDLSVILYDSTSYSVDLLIFENSQRVNIAHGYVVIAQKYADVTPKHTEAAPAMSGDSSIFGGLFMLILIAGIIVFVILILVAVSRKADRRY
jgi:hypothetical protein